MVGLGYVGLPLAVGFAAHFEVIGYDRSKERIAELKRGVDRTHGVEEGALERSELRFTSDPQDLRSCTFVVVAVPTPITKAREPDLSPLESASAAVGRILQPGMLVVYESTVFPGVTEDVCLPTLEKESGLKLGEFALGYSPERINPGDTEHRVSDTVKVVSGHDAAALKRVADTYGGGISDDKSSTAYTKNKAESSEGQGEGTARAD